MKIKKCTKCGKIKPISRFSKCRRNKNGLCSCCKLCQKKYRQDHKKEICKYMKQWQKDNPGYRKQRHQDHKESDNERSKKWRKDHPEYHKEYNKQWNRDNPRYNKQWQKNNKDKCCRITQRRRAKIRNLPYDLSHTEWAFTKTLFEDKCAYCEEPIKGAIHHEHIIIPENGGGFTFGNIIPACGACNHSKWKHNVWKWMKEKNYNIQKFKDRMQIIEFIKRESNERRYS